jgi:hypothetical protein
MTTAAITDPYAAFTFLKSGNATFTLVSKAIDKRYTFKVRQPEDANVHFVSAMYGNDNENAFSYMGIIGARGDFIVTQKSRFKDDSPQVKAFRWAYSHLKSNHMPDQLEFWHEGKCGRCGRKLTVPSSIASGIGPECARRIVCNAA